MREVTRTPHDRPHPALRGTTPWTRYAIAFDIPAGAEWLNYGLLLSGRGTLRAADIQLASLEGGRSRRLTLWHGKKHAAEAAVA